MRRRSGTAPFQLFSFQDIITSVMGIVVLILLVLALELSQRQLTSAAAQHTAVRKETRQTLAEVNQEIERLRQLLNKESILGFVTVTSAELDEKESALASAIPAAQARRREAVQHLARLEERFRSEDEELRRLRATAALPEKLANVESAKKELAKWDGQGRVLYRTSPSELRSAWLVELDATRIQVARVGIAERPLQIDDVTEEDRIGALLRWASELEPDDHILHLLIKPGATDAFLKVELALRLQGLAIGIDLLGKHQTAIDPVSGAAAPSQSKEPVDAPNR